MLSLLRCVSFSFSVFLLTSCGDLESWSHDVPQIRQLQEQSLQGLPARPIAGQSLEDFFRDKVGLILSGRNSFPSGRAIPISRDGYFLTAWHVVDKEKFFLSDFVSLKPLPLGQTVQAKDYYRNDLYSGRLVWRDQRADLAIVKFDYEPEFIFYPAESTSAVGEQVYSAAIGTNSGSLLVVEDTAVGSGVGNGPYRTAGKVLKARSFERLPWTRYESDLVARGGMSGGAVVDSGGNLVGVLTQIRATPFRSPFTTFAMLGNERISQILLQDRAQSQKRATEVER